MLPKLLLLAGIITLSSCNSEEKTSTPATPTEKTTTGSGDNAAKIADLNAQSKQCISTMNSAEQAQNAAIANGNKEIAAACQKTIDSAARANALIGQQLMELQK